MLGLNYTKIPIKLILKLQAKHGFEMYGTIPSLSAPEGICEEGTVDSQIRSSLWLWHQAMRKILNCSTSWLHGFGQVI